MKKILLSVAAALLIAATAFAADPNPTAPQGPMGRGMMGRPNIDWKIGTSVLTEYKKLTGQVVFGEKLAPLFKAEGVEYKLLLPKQAELSLDVKNGDTVTFEGLATTIKEDGKTDLVFHPFKATYNGKDIDLKVNGGMHRPGNGPDRGNMMPGGERPRQ